MMASVGSLRAEERIAVSGPAVAGLEPFDRLMVDFLKEHHGVGASLAVTRNGRLVYARGFGLADKQTRAEVKPESLFRLASVSKPITAITVMKLVDEGKLKLADRAFEMVVWDPVKQQGQETDPRLKQITVLELLQHRGGFDRDASTDPMFHSVEFAKLCAVKPPAMQEQIIRVMEGRPLDFAPGEKFAYSNFGYCVLGRVIEKATGERYQEAVQREVLSPLGITHMRVGKTLERFPGEVTYYTAKGGTAGSVFPPIDKQVPLPYGAWCLEAMDSHGAWIASAPEIVKLASSLDDAAGNGVLKAATVKRMFERPPGLAGLEGGKPGAKPSVVWYGCGWNVRDNGDGTINTWHTGLLAGTSTLLVRRSDGLDWAVLFNQDSDEQGHDFAGMIDPLVHRAANAVKAWPAGKSREQEWP
jgi:N-acyl-D-amino-acid deacylase